MPVSPVDVPVNTTGHWIPTVRGQRRSRAPSAAVGPGVVGRPSPDPGVNDGHPVRVESRDHRCGRHTGPRDLAALPDRNRLDGVGCHGRVRRLESAPTGGLTVVMPNRTDVFDHFEAPAESRSRSGFSWHALPSPCVATGRDIPGEG
jgi:hypothetical protein